MRCIPKHLHYLTIQNTTLVGHKKVLIIFDLSYHIIMQTSMSTSLIHDKWKNQKANPPSYQKNDSH